MVTGKVEVAVAFKGIDSSAPVKEYAEKKAEKLAKFFHQLAICHYVFETKNGKHVAHLRLSSGDFEASAEALADKNFFEAIDEVSDKIAHQSRKHKEKAETKTHKAAVRAKA